MAEKLKKNFIRFALLFLKLLTCLALYFNLGMLVWYANDMMYAVGFGKGYAVLISGMIFLIVQFFFAMRALRDLFSGGQGGVSALLKLLAFAAVYLSLAILLVSGPTLISTGATANDVMTLIGMLFLLLQCSLASYGIAELLQKKTMEVDVN